MKCREVIDFIRKHKMEDKDIDALLVRDGGVWSESIESIQLSCPEDDCVFMRVNAGDKPNKKRKLSGPKVTKPAKDDWKEMSTKEWAKVLYLRKHKHFTAKDILQEPDPREALSMPCQYPGCRTKTKQVNSNLCRAHQKRWEEGMSKLYPKEKP